MNFYENMSFEDDAPTNINGETDTEWILNHENIDHSELPKDIKFLVKKSKRISKQKTCEITLLIVLFLAITGNLVISGLFYYFRDSEGRVNN